VWTRGESLGWYVQMMHMVIPVHPDRANQTQHPRYSSGDGSHNPPVAQKEGATIFSSAKVIVDVVARDGMEGVMGSEPFVEAASWWHLFSIDFAFAATKDFNLKLSLKSTKIMDLQVVVSIDREAGHIPKGKTDVAGGFSMAKRVAKGLIVWKSVRYYSLS